MRRALASWRVALRIARRDARRHLGMTALAIAMIALPIAGATAAAVLVATNNASIGTQLTRAIGAADASFTLAAPGQAIAQDRLGQNWATPGDLNDIFFGGVDSAAGPEADLATQLSWVRAIVPDATGILTQTISSTAVTSGRRQLTAKAWEYDLADPMAAGRLQMLRGAVPRATNQVLVTKAVADALRLSVGAHLSAYGHEFTVSGIAYLLSADTSAAAVIGPPGAFGLARLPISQLSVTFFVSSPTPIGASQVSAANAKGMLVAAPRFARHPTATAQAVTDATSANRTAIATLLAVVGLFVLVQVVLLAGPAFAVTARRSRRDLALASAAGAPPRQLRRTVLAGGVVVGVLAGIGGVAVGLLAGALAARPWGGFHILGKVLGPIRFPWWQSLALVAVGLVAALVAALFPARGATRRHTRSALSRGELSTRRARRATPIVGAACLALGVVGALWLEYWQPDFPARDNRPMILAVATFAAAEAGMIMIVPALLRLLGRSGRHLPLLARLASRDAARATGRTAPGVAAVMAVMAAAFAVGIGINSSWVQGKNSYQPMAQPGQLTVSFDTPPSAAQTAGVRSALASVSPINGTVAVSAPAPLAVAADGATAPITAGAANGPTGNGGGAESRSTILSFTPVRADANTCPLTPALSSDATTTVDSSSPAAGATPTTVTGPTVANESLTPAGQRILGGTDPRAADTARGKPQCAQFDAQNPVRASSGHATPPVLLAGIVIDDGSGAPVLAPGAARPVASALAAGMAVVFSPDDLSDGRALVQKSVFADATVGMLGLGMYPGDPYAPQISSFVERAQLGAAGQAAPGSIRGPDQQVSARLIGLSRVLVPAVAVRDPDARALMILPPALADRLGMTASTVQVIATTTAMPSSAQQALATAAVFGVIGKGAQVDVERGYQNSIANVFPIALWACWALCLLIVVVASALAMADAKRDLSICAAVGANPGLRRRLAAANALTLSALGVGTGFVAGLMAVIALIGFSSHQCASGPTGSCSAAAGLTEPGLSLNVPWGWAALLAVGAPVLAAAVMAVFTRARIPLLPRAE
ncbi:MAG: hypothetical protein FWD74_11380 [Actinomycetia bacterium]|nr:hypothetical protein [Actinomycetes bacterium]